MAKQEDFIFSISGQDFTEKMVGKTIFKPNEETSTIEKFIVRGMYKDGNKIVVALALDNIVQHLSYGMTDSSGFYLTEKNAEKTLLKRKIFKVQNQINHAKRQVLSRENQIEILQKKLVSEKEHLKELENSLFLLKY